jgi:hypothetical protein
MDIDRQGNQELKNVPLSHTYFSTEFDKSQVAIGDWAKYSVNATWHSSDPNAVEPTQVKEQKQEMWMKIEVENVTNAITFSQIIHYQNGTEKALQPTVGDPKQNFLTYIVPSGLKQNDRIPSGYIPFSPVKEITGVYAGMRRSVAYTNFTMSFFGMNATMKMYWDRSTGLLCEMNTTTSTRINSDVSTQSTVTKMIETNLWLPRGGIKLTVLDGSGKPIVGANVSSMMTPSEQASLNGFSGSDGSIIFSDVVVGNYTLQASMSSYLTNHGSVTVVPNYLAASSITLQTTGGVSGGISGYSFEEIIAGIIFGIVVLILLRRRV